MCRVVQAYVSPCQGSKFFFMPTQGGAILRTACPGLGMSRPVGANFSKTNTESRFVRFGIYGACHMVFEFGFEGNGLFGITF
jgi:hypothetical protein